MSTAPPFLQSYVVPVCRFKVDDGAATILTLEGTAFFISSKGHFVTARHVLDGSEARCKNEPGTFTGLVVKSLDPATPAKNLLAPILLYEGSLPPFDIAVGQVHYTGPTTLTLRRDEVVDVWLDVATFGYPIHAVSGPPDKMNLNLRAHKGYVQRMLNPGDIAIAPNPSAYELSFVLSQGLSGAPLFSTKYGPAKRDTVIGVCVGSVRSEIIEDEHVEVIDGDTKYRETKLKIEQHGIAHDIRPLLDWRPKVFEGKSLLEVANEGDPA